MKRFLKNIFVFVFTSVLTLGLIILAYYIMFRLSFSEKNYYSAKSDAISYLKKNKDIMIKVADKCYNDKICDQNESLKNSYKNNYDNRGYVEFYVDGQGMLGGQSWGIIYTPFIDFIDGEHIYIYIYDEKETSKGNNIIIIEKIENNWYFYYIDYDGEVDLTKFQ